MSGEPSQGCRPLVKHSRVDAPAVDAAVARAVAGGEGAPVGRFRYDVEGRSWWWSEGLYSLYGFQSDDVVPTAELLWSHHLDSAGPPTRGDQAPHASRGPSRDPGRGAGREGPSRDPGRGPGRDGAFSRVHRIRDAEGVVRTLVSVGQAHCDEHERVVTVTGYVMDVSAVNRSAVAREAAVAVERSAVTRAGIERAKGVVMAIRRTSAQDAFELLRWHSQHGNIKLRDLAAMVVEEASRSAADGHEAALDRLLEDVLSGRTSTRRSRVGPARDGPDTPARRPPRGAPTCEDEDVAGGRRRGGGGGGEREGDDPHPARGPGGQRPP
jgi:ANTAR domain